MVICRVCLCLSMMWLGTLASVVAAPAPFHREGTVRNRTLQETLPGEWNMKWGGMTYDLTLDSDGGYKCSNGTLKYVGCWSADGHGQFLITESCRPLEVNSWTNYKVQFEPGTLRGREDKHKCDVLLTRK